MRLLQWLGVISVRLPAVLILMLALFVWVESISLAQVPQRSVASLAVSPLSPDRELALQPKDSFTECAKCPEMVVVPAGEFTMGSPPTGEPVELPQHKVTFTKPFAVSKFEVTFDEWDACEADGDCSNARDWRSWGRGRQPVINVTWDDAKRYAAWLSKVTGKTYRLLSESEWEYAARAKTQTVYFWGDEIGKNKANCDGCGSEWDGRQTAPVGSFAPNAFGLYDMQGNVAEWLEDIPHANYEGAPADGAAWTAEENCILCEWHIVRGGSYRDAPQELRSAYRGSWHNPESGDNNLGIRIARTLNP